MKAPNKQALRLTAEKAKDNFMPNLMVPTLDLLALLDELEAEQRICSTWRKTAESNSEKLEAAEKSIAEQNKTLMAARSYVKSHAAGDGHAFGVLQAIDRAAGIGVKGETK